jgi:hypothetical protein
MSGTRTAIGLGLRRGWIEFVNSLRSPQDQGFYLFTGGGTLAYLWFNRDGEIEGAGISLVSYTLPSLLAALLAFGVVIGPAFALAMEREDGTLLRHKALPHGMPGYVTGQLLYHSLGLLPMLLIILVPSFFLFDDVMARGAAGWLTVAWVVVLCPAPRRSAPGGCSPSSSSRGSRASSSRCKRCGAGCRSSRRCSRPTGSAWACGRRSCRTRRSPSRWGTPGAPG